MNVSDPIPMVRCRLDASNGDPGQNLRYVPQAEFGLWRYLMEHRHCRAVSVEEVSIWVAEDAARWNSGYEAEDLEPVLRLRLHMVTREGTTVVVERFFPAESYPDAQEALLSHFAPGACQEASAVPGYFVPRRLHAPSSAPARTLA